MFVYIVSKSILIDEHRYREQFHKVYKEYKVAKEFINNYLEILEETNSVKVNYESEDSFHEKYVISYSYNGFYRTIKERFTITRERLY